VNEKEVPGLALLARLVRAKGSKAYDTFTVPGGRKQQVVSTAGKNGPKADWRQSPVA
jgi:hypothetical protein